MTGIIDGISGVEQPRGGFLPIELFDPVPITLGDGRVLSRENLPADIIDGAVKILSCMEALARDTSFELADCILLERVERAVFEKTHSSVFYKEPAEVYAEGITVRIGGFDQAAADCACRLAYCMGRQKEGYSGPSRIRADDRTCTNIITMCERMTSFLDVMGPARRICFRFHGGYGSAVTDGYGLFLTDGCLWDVTTSSDPLPEKDRLGLLVRYILSRGSADPALRSITNIGIMNPRLHCAYMMPTSMIPTDSMTYVTEGVVGRITGSQPSVRESRRCG